jgi:hypothetical protein
MTVQAPADLGPAPTRANASTPAPLLAGRDTAQRDSLRDLLRPVLGFLANVTVLTALLVYFGWRRSETQAQLLGIDESVLGMSTRDYLLRSVGPVLTLLVGVSAAGFVWLTIDRHLAPLVRSASDRSTGRRVAVWIMRLLAVAWLVLPGLVWLSGFVWRPAAFVLFPASIGAGVFLAQYAAHLRQVDSAQDPASRRRNLVRYALTGLLIGVCLFWTASNYAQVEGIRLARYYAERISRLPGVAVYSEGRLHLEGPGVAETELAGGEGSPRYRYTGLRLLEHTGGTFFLVSDGWTTTYGVVSMLRDDDGSIRLDLIRDRR